MNEQLSTSSKPDMLRAALDLAGRRLPVFPCHSIFPLVGGCDCKKRLKCMTPAKHPHIRQWPKKATVGTPQIRKWWKQWPDANPAVLTGGNLLVIDVDPRHGGVEAVARLEDEFGPLSRSWSVATGGGGLHLYFTVPYDVEIEKPDRWKADGVEIKHEGHYVIGPGSKHVSGKTYAWTSQIGDRPAFPLSWLGNLRSPQSVNADKPDDPHNKPALHEWFKRPTDNLSDEINETLNTDRSDNTDNYSVVSGLSDLSVSSDTRSKILEAMEITLPRRTGIRNSRLIELGRWLLRIEELQEKDAEWFRPVIQLWLDRAEPFIGPRDFEETWSEWLYAWGLWLEKSIDEHPVFKAAELMKRKPNPPVPVQGYRSDTARRLVALCAALAEVAADGDGVFYISCRDAARVLGLDPEKHCRFVGSVFQQMVRDRILERIGDRKPGSMKAQRYKYLPYKQEKSQMTAA